MSNELTILLAVDRPQGVHYANTDYNRNDWLEGRLRVATSLKDLLGLRGYTAVMVGTFPSETEHHEMAEEAKTHGRLSQGSTR